MDNLLHIKNGILGTIAVIGAFIADSLGGCDDMLNLLGALMCLDFMTGWLVAAVWKKSNKSESGALNSKAGFKGLIKKCMILVMVTVGVLLDRATGASYARNMVIVFFIGNEGLSLLENFGLMGVPFPAFLKRALEVLHDQGNKGGGELV